MGIRRCIVAIRGLGVAILFAATLASATEVDNFTDRSSLSKDALTVLDGKVNLYLDRAIAAANEDSSCSKMELRQQFIRWVGPDPVSILEMWTSVTDEVQRIPTSFEKSIYHDASFREAPMMLFWGIGRSFLLSGHIIGTDKIGHFFMQGLHYYKMVEEEDKDLDWVLTHEHGEDGVYGLSTTGVKSWGDMSANYGGYLFWNSLYHGDRPYVRCEAGKRWVKTRRFTWADYVNDAWDEAINCSDMLPTLAAKVKRNLSRMGKSCPVDPMKCAALVELDKAEFYVNPLCFALAGESEKPARAPAESAPQPGVPQPVHYYGFQAQEN